MKKHQTYEKDSRINHFDSVHWNRAMFALTGDQANALRNLGDATIWEYEPLIGLTKETTPDGRSSSFTYNASGKLHQILDDLGCKTSAYLYSPDNRQ